MKVFISWSGPTGEKIARAISDCIVSVIQTVEAFVSADDINKGARWQSELTNQLADVHFGIVCLTPESQKSDWVMFEAGALSKILDKARVCPLLFGLRKSEVRGPLAMFQLTVFDKADFYKLLKDIHAAAVSNEEKVIDASRLDMILDKWWPGLEGAVAAIISAQPQEQPKEPEAPANVTSEHLARIENILEELIDLSRSSSQFIHTPTNLLPAQYLRQALMPLLHRRSGWSDPTYSRQFHNIIMELEKRACKTPGVVPDEIVDLISELHNKFHERDMERRILLKKPESESVKADAVLPA